MNRLALSVLFVLLAVLASVSITGFSTVGATPDAQLVIDDVTVEPETPTTGAPVTLTASVDSSPGSDEIVSIDAVELRHDDETVINATTVGSLSPGDGLTAPLTTTFDEPGEYDLTVRVHATNSTDGTMTVDRPVSLVVESGAPQLETNTDDVVNETPSTVETVVANPTEAQLRDIEVTVGGNGFDGLTDRRVVSALDPGEERELQFEIQPDSVGELELETVASYTTGAGTVSEIARSDTLTAVEAEYDVSIEVSTIADPDEPEETVDDIGDIGIDIPGIGGGDGDGTEPGQANSDVGVTVSNVGNAPVTNVVLDTRTNNESISTRPVTMELSPGEEQTLPISLAQLTGDPTFEASYTAGSTRESVSTTLERQVQPGAVAVTGVDLDRDDETVVITGDVGNTGGGSVTGVVVAVEDGDDVTPSYPARDFFVGEIEGDGFAPFEVTASVGENATHVPLTVSYTVDGADQTEAVSLPVEGLDDDEDDDGLSSLVLVGLALVLVGLVVVVLGILLRRR